MWSDWLVFCDGGFSLSALWCPLSVPTALLGFLLPWTWGICSWLLQRRAAAAPYLGRGVAPLSHLWLQRHAAAAMTLNIGPDSRASWLMPCEVLCTSNKASLPKTRLDLLNLLDLTPRSHRWNGESKLAPWGSRQPRRRYRILKMNLGSSGRQWREEMEGTR